MTIIYQEKPEGPFVLASVGSLVSETIFFPAFYFTILHSLEISDDKTCDTCSSSSKTTPPEL